VLKIRGNKVLRALDQTAGRVVVAALGVLPKRALPQDPQRIGVLKTAAIGDTILISALLQDLRAAYPRATITMFSGTDNAEAAALVACAPVRHEIINAANVPAALGILRRHSLDVLIDCGSWPRLDAALAALSGARYRVGFNTAGQQRHWGFDAPVEHSRGVHELENYRSLVRAVNASPAALPRIAPQQLPRVASSMQPPFIVFHPWAGGVRSHLREWPASRWAELAVAIAGVAGSVAVTAPPQERARASALVNDLRRAGIQADALHDLSLAALAATLLHAQAVVSVNTGVMHLSAALGVPTVGLHGPTSATRWGPVGPATRSVSSRCAGCGYLHLGFEYDGHRVDCMDGVMVEDVANAVRDVISSDNRAR
jgi:ADP-heptose:LPS heptosyltransferase